MGRQKLTDLEIEAKKCHACKCQVGSEFLSYLLMHGPRQQLQPVSGAPKRALLRGYPEIKLKMVRTSSVGVGNIPKEDSVLVLEVGDTKDTFL